MMHRRWYRRCGADFIHGTMNLSLEEKGAYSLCLDLIYDRGGPIPDDARWLSGVCGVSIRRWNGIRQRLIDAGKLSNSDGFLMNPRAAHEIVSAELSSKKLSESGAKGGRKRAENQFDYNKISDLAQALLKHIREEKSREEEKEKKEVTALKRAAPLVFEGRVIRLNQRDFDTWHRDYPDLDLRAVLRARDDWLVTEADDHLRKKWFIATSNHLANLQQKVTTAKQDTSYDPARITV